MASSIDLHDDFAFMKLSAQRLGIRCPDDITDTGGHNGDPLYYLYDIEFLVPATEKYR